MTLIRIGSRICQHCTPVPDPAMLRAGFYTRQGKMGWEPVPDPAMLRAGFYARQGKMGWG
jgi:hypothetical protein